MGEGKGQQGSLLGFSLANLAAQQTQDVECKKFDSDNPNVLKERSSNVPNRDDQESMLTSNLSKLTLSVGKQESKSGLVEKSFTTKQIIGKTTGLNIPIKPASFALADLAKEHSSSPPSSFSKMSSTPPRQQIMNQPVSGVSLAQLAQQQSGSPPTRSMIQQGKNTNHSTNTGSGISLAASVQRHSEESGQAKETLQLKNMLVVSSSSGAAHAVKQTVKSHPKPRNFSLSALAARHEQKTSNIQTVYEDERAQNVQKHINKLPIPPPGFKPKREVDLSALAAQHKIPEPSQIGKVVPTKFMSKQVKSVQEVLTTKPSIFGQALCSNYFRVKAQRKSSALKGLSYPKFSFIRQISKVSNSPTLDTRPIVPFDFSSPSPDDIVLKRQQGAFTRTGTYLN